MTHILTIPEFVKKYNPCGDARAYLSTQESIEIAWTDCKRGDWMLWTLKQVNYQDIRALQYVALEVAESVRHLMTDERSTNVLKVTKRFLLGQATKEELETAADAAADAAYAAADAAYAAAYAAQADIVRKYVSWEQIKPYLIKSV